MAQVRTIQPGEIERFAECCTQHEDVADIRHFLDKWLAMGAVRYEWCCVVEDEGRFLGRVAGRARPPAEAPGDIVMLDLPWEGDYLGVGELLLGVLPELGAAQLRHAVDLPPDAPNWQRYPDRLGEVLIRNGFALQREAINWQLAAGDALPRDSGRLGFRPLAESDEASFLDAIRRASAGTLDGWIREEIDEFGAAQAAARLLARVKGIGFDPHWWQLAFDAGGELVGFLMPAGGGEWGTFGYIGVLPEQRGRGYVDDLVARGIATMRAAGVTRIEDLTDATNIPMANALRRAGYTEHGRRREYVWRRL